MTKLNPAGTALVYSTFLGGSNVDFGNGIAVDGAGQAYVMGETTSVDFPITAGAFKTGLAALDGDFFVTKLNPTGTALVYSTYLGGSGNETSNCEGTGHSAIAVDATGNAYVSGSTESADFPITAGAFQTGLAALGADVFVTKLNPTGTALVYSTYLGGENTERACSIAVDTSGNAYVTGFTNSDNFPIASAFQPALGAVIDAFVTKLNPTGTALVYSTYLGVGDSNTAILGYGIAVDTSVVSQSRLYSDGLSPESRRRFWSTQRVWGCCC